VRLLKILTIVVGSLVVLAAAALLVTVQFRWKRTFDAPYPDIHATRDAAVIARGEYLVYGPGHCAPCHTPKSDEARVAAGERLPLRGGHEWRFPLGRVYSPNLTPDPETGIGRIPDPALARVLRHGVRPDGRAAIPFMEFHDLSDEDLTAIISFLRAQPPVSHRVPDHEMSVLGKVVMSFVLGPEGPAATPPRVSPAAEPSVERGRYLAAGLAGCVECHTQRSTRDGSYVGARFAGGMEMETSDGSGRVFVTPNLTPHDKTGHIYHWTEDAFVTRFKLGGLAPGTPMPWANYRNMKEEDVRAIYRYLRSLSPVDHATGPVVRAASNP
jgi:mono/diheme cytochrome c family protein